MNLPSATTTDPILNDPRAGFSLVDMLVALVLLAVVSGLMASFIGQFRVINRLRTDRTAQMELDALAGYLENTIGSAMTLPFVAGQEEQRLSFEGTATKLRFVTIARQGARSFGLRESGISLKDKTIVQDFSPRRLDKTDRASASTSIDLAGGVALLEFRYLSYDATTRQPRWTTEWLSRSGLPAAVRIAVAAERNEKMLRSDGHAILKMATGETRLEQ
jgi:type II secretory pathway component PulJ